MQAVLVKQEREIPELSDNCPECESTIIIHDPDTGEDICGDCGLVVKEQMINEGPEWQAFTPEEKLQRSRVGTPKSYSEHYKGLSPTMNSVDTDAFGRRLPIKIQRRMRILRKWNIRSRVYKTKDKNFAQAMAELDRLQGKLYFTDTIKDRAAMIYQEALNEGLIRGRTIVGLTPAALCVAYQTTGIPRTLREVAEASLVDEKTIGRNVRVLKRKLHCKSSIYDIYDIREHINKVAEIAGISGKNVISAIEYYEKARSRGYQGKSPMGGAAGVLYYACQKNGREKTQKEIGEAAGVTEQTMRNVYRSLKKILGPPN